MTVVYKMKGIFTILSGVGMVDCLNLNLKMDTKREASRTPTPMSAETGNPSNGDIEMGRRDGDGVTAETQLGSVTVQVPEQLEDREAKVRQKYFLFSVTKQL